MIGQSYDQHLQHSEALEASGQRQRLPRRARILLGCAIFLFAFTLRAWFNFGMAHANCAGCCDASEFVRNAQALQNLFAQNCNFEFFIKVFSVACGAAPPSQIEAVKVALSSLHELYQGGPIFPLFIILSNFLVGPLAAFVPSLAVPLAAPVLMQCVLSAVTCIFVFTIASRAWDLRTGIISGFVAALYPAFIVNSGRLYTETFATFLLCAILAVLVRGFYVSGNVILRPFAVGFAAAALQLTRSVMVVLSVLDVPILLWQLRHRRPVVVLTSFILGCAAVLLPWVVFQKAGTGSGSVVVDRVGNYNLFIGTNTDTLGWLSFPYPDGHGTDKMSIATLLQKNEAKSPTRFAQVLLDKPARLWAFPWNDFKTAIGPVNIWWQVAFHQIVMVLAAAGLILSFVVAPGVATPSKEQLSSRTLLLTVFLFHCIYFLFITVPRYNLTSIPIAIIFASAGISAIIELGKSVSGRLTAAGVAVASLAVLAASRANLLPDMMLSLPSSIAVDSILKFIVVMLWLACLWRAISLCSGYRRIARAGLVVGALVILPLLALPLRAYGRIAEWACPLTDTSHPVEQLIQLEKVSDLPKAESSSGYMLIDVNKVQSLAGVNVAVNGVRLDSPRLSGMSLVQTYDTLQHEAAGKIYWEGEEMLSSLARPADSTNADLRQWAVLPIPADLLKKGLADKHFRVSLRPRSGSCDAVIYGSYQNAKSHKHDAIPSPFSYSWEKAFYAVENAAGIADPRLDYRTENTSEKIYDTDLSSNPGRQTGSYNIRLLITKSNGETKLLSSPLAVAPVEQSKKATETIAIAAGKLPAIKPKATWIVRLKGWMKVKEGSPSPMIEIKAVTTDANSKASTYRSPWTPSHMSIEESWTPFDVSVLLPVGFLNGKIARLEAAFSARTPYWKEAASPVSSDAVEFKQVSMDVEQIDPTYFAFGSRVF